MMKNEYDDNTFFNRYAQMTRSREGLDGAGEWHQLKKMFPPLQGKKVLDLGCGYGWHCRYAADQGAEEVLGIDVSGRMLEEARRRCAHERITYRRLSFEEYEYPRETWDCVVSNLALHYTEDLESIFHRVYRTLKPGGTFLFNIEHPVFTAAPEQDWIRDEGGRALYWPVDNYFYPGERKTQFLGCEVLKYHHTLSQILGGLLACSFVIGQVEEARPSLEMMDIPGMEDEMRRPMMLMVRAGRKPE